MMNAVQKAIVIAIGFAAVMRSAAIVGDETSEVASEKAMNASVERQERIVSLRRRMEEELSFTLELIRDDEGQDALFIDTSNLPANGEMYGIYVCWLDEPVASDGRPRERMEKICSVRGAGRHATKSGASAVSSSYGRSSACLRLNSSHTAAPDGYYGRGRVCAMAVSSDGIYVSNIATVPERPSEPATSRADELGGGEDTNRIGSGVTSPGDAM